jgi:hypothetical protein
MTVIVRVARYPNSIIKIGSGSAGSVETHSMIVRFVCRMADIGTGTAYAGCRRVYAGKSHRVSKTVAKLVVDRGEPMFGNTAACKGTVVRAAAGLATLHSLSPEVVLWWALKGGDGGLGRAGPQLTPGHRRLSRRQE